MIAGYLRRHVWEALGITLTLVCLWLAVRGARLSDVLAVLADANAGLVFVAAVITALAYGATALRWQLLFSPRHTPPLRPLLAGLLLAQLANTLLPAKLGPVVRAVYVGEVEGISKPFVLGTVLAEKVWEGLALLAVSALAVFLVPWPDWLDGPVSVLGGTSLVLFLMIWFMGRCEPVLKALANRLPRIAGSAVERWSRSFLDGLDVWQLSGAGLKLAGWSVLIWAMIASLSYVLLRALKVQAPGMAVLLLLVALQAGARVPSAPAHVGVFHYLIIASLGLFGVPQSAALGYALILHALIFLLPAAVGACVLLGMPRAGRARLRTELPSAGWLALR